jgi:hypothetical protein
MMKYLYTKISGVALMSFGVLGIIGLLFFYSTVLFSDTWPQLAYLNESFRILFTIPSGIMVMYVSFIIICIPLLYAVIFGAELLSGKIYVTNMQRVLLLSVWFIALLFGSVVVLNQSQQLMKRLSPFSNNPVVFDIGQEIKPEVQAVFRTTLKNEVVAKQGQPIEGFEPFMFLKVFPGLTESDFEGAEASIGYYTMEDGRLVHKTDTTKLIHSAAKALTDMGLDTVLANTSVRLKVDLTQEGTLTEVMEALVRSSKPVSMPSQPSIPKNQIPTPSQPPSTPDADNPVACTMDAKICPDGSAVGRQGPDCAFAPCPTVGETQKVTHTCTQQEKNTQMCTREYAPVCGSVRVQCVTTPCPPVEETFSNGCTACAQPSVTSYTQGAC